eukprot:CAMPEP_0170555728 /NCGR_PEP_ID=MMETSP0211-20121228/13571_1 /TAXON_ID=311385 /ORGANISM="Pseudokeronopsis sp., Strain OXSARD2" /LENGTH=364 /DNA_ID=CAMNT_0010865709 /DNA_START=594 /DNA_END=1688 /DNA_ORIENTATION=-
MEDGSPCLVELGGKEQFLIQVLQLLNILKLVPGVRRFNIHIDHSIIEALLHVLNLALEAFLFDRVTPVVLLEDVVGVQVRLLHVLRDKVVVAPVLHGLQPLCSLTPSFHGGSASVGLEGGVFVGDAAVEGAGGVLAGGVHLVEVLALEPRVVLAHSLALPLQRLLLLLQLQSIADKVPLSLVDLLLVELLHRLDVDGVVFHHQDRCGVSHLPLRSLRRIRRRCLILCEELGDVVRADSCGLFPLFVSLGREVVPIDLVVAGLNGLIDLGVSHLSQLILVVLDVDEFGLDFEDFEAVRLLFELLVVLDHVDKLLLLVLDVLSHVLVEPLSSGLPPLHTLVRLVYVVLIHIHLQKLLLMGLFGELA